MEERKWAQKLDTNGDYKKPAVDQDTGIWAARVGMASREIFVSNVPKGGRVQVQL